MRWKAPVRATTWHVVERALSGARVANPKLLATLQPVVVRLADSIEAAGHEPVSLITSLLPLTLGDASTHDMLHNEETSDVDFIAQFIAAIDDVEQVLRQAVPRIEQELAIRTALLQAQWEAFGPGLVRSIERLTGTAANADPITLNLVLVYPATGGYACAFPAAHVALWEAVLTDVEPRLPEVLRVGWLAAQQTLWMNDTAQSEEALFENSALRLAAAAVTLSAGQELDLTRDDRETLELALKTWRPSQTHVSATAALVSDWWSAARGQHLGAALWADLARRLTPS
jgi:hypothetical protein